MRQILTMVITIASILFAFWSVITKAESVNEAGIRLAGEFKYV